MVLILGCLGYGRRVHLVVALGVARVYVLAGCTARLLLNIILGFCWRIWILKKEAYGKLRHDGLELRGREHPGVTKIFELRPAGVQRTIDCCDVGHFWFLQIIVRLEVWLEENMLRMEMIKNRRRSKFIHMYICSIASSDPT